ncbi:MAG: P-II family nitrogen regulator [Clostridiales bacterium]|nr:P-II family nitrogen regulator [Clostridiales bacterium]
METIKALFVIANAGYAEEIISLARSVGVLGATILNARGEGAGAHHKSVLGITVDTEKEILLILTDADTAERAMAAIKQDMGRGSKAHGICFTLPVERVVGLASCPDKGGTA